MRILIFGDSIAQGYYDLEMGGWVNLLFIENMRRKARRTDNPTEIFNVAVSGDTVRRVIDRLKIEVNARRWGVEPITLVFAVGMNDAMLDNDQPLFSLQQYLANLEELHSIARPLARHIVFVGLGTVNEAESNPWIFNSGTHALRWSNERIQQFNKALKEFSKEKDAHFVAVFDAFREAQNQGETLHQDGLHPNAAGHRLISEQVQKIIDALPS